MNKESFFHEIQGILSIGYLYLILMGILNQTLYYNQLGIDILEYSTILDVLISPIAKIANKTSGTLFFLSLIIISFFLPSYLSKHKDKAWFHSSFKLPSYSDKEEVESSLLKKFLFLSALALFGFFIGSGVGGGYKVSNKIAANEIEYNDNLTLMSGETYPVAILGKNSAYLFYLTKESKTVKVTPISGTVKSIEEIK